MDIGLRFPFRYPLTPLPSAASPPCSCLGSFPPLLFFHGRIPSSMLLHKHCMTFAISSHMHETLLLIRHCDALLFFHARRASFSDPRALSEGAAYKKLALLPGSRQFLLYPFVCGRWKKIMHFARQSAEAIRFPGSHIPHASLPATFSPPHCTNTYRCLPRLPRVHRWKDYPPP